MMIKQIQCTAIWVGLMAISTNAAIQISVVGDGSGYDILGTGAANHEATAYRSTGVPKTFDADDDNVYGTAGVFLFGDGGAEINHQPFSLHTQMGAAWASFVEGVDFKDIAQGYGQGLLDNPTAPIRSRVPNWGNVATAVTTPGDHKRVWRKILSFTISDSAPQKFRIGLISGTQFQEDGRWDPIGLRITVDGGRSYATVVALENNGNGHPNWVFFDVDLKGATSGTFTIEGAQRLDFREGDSKGVGVSLTGVTFDVISRPATLGQSIAPIIHRGLPFYFVRSGVSEQITCL